MSIERKIARIQLKELKKIRGDLRRIPFRTLWARLQFNKYGEVKATALHAIGKGLGTSLTLQVKRKAI